MKGGENKMYKLLKGLMIAVISVFVMVETVLAVASFFNGFEINTDGWFTNGGSITRVASGTNGITSATGDYHAEAAVGADFNGIYTRWGGYENAFPAEGYITKVDVYLNMAENPTLGTDKRFDFSSAINQPDGNHRRDFVFSVGTNPLLAGQFIMTVSNNAPGWPSNPGRDPFVISQTGWYTLRHTFQNDGTGVLEVVMDVLDSNGVLLHSWTLSDASDVIGTTVGGNRYGWVVTSDFSFLAIDNTAKENIVTLTTPTAKESCKNGGWTSFNNPFFKNQGDCVSYVQSNSNATGNKTK